MITKDQAKTYLAQKYPGVEYKWNEIRQFKDEEVINEMVDFANHALNNTNVIDGIIGRFPDDKTKAAYQECFETYIPPEKWDEATQFLSTYDNGLAEDIAKKEK